MRQETFTLSQKELQRVSMINACIKADIACARAAGLLGLSVRQIKRLKKRIPGAVRWCAGSSMAICWKREGNHNL